MYFVQLKKFFLGISVVMVLNFLCASSLYAQDETPPPADAGSTTTTTTTSTATTGAAGATGGVSCSGMDCLPLILQSSNSILAIVNAIPVYLDTYVTKLLLSLKAVDDSKEFGEMQYGFALLGQTIKTNFQSQLDTQQLLMAQIVNQPISAFAAQGTAQPTILGLLPNINDLAYSSYFNAPPAPPPAGSGQPFKPSINYVSYASGGNLAHAMPNRGWQGLDTDKTSYTNYYNTVVAIESFNNFVLSDLYVDSSNAPDKTTTSLQNSLKEQASSSNWLSIIASEELGKVLRETLMFQSQSYVLLSQILQTQKQLLTATVMTNTLLIANNRINEAYLAGKAQGISPKM